MKNRPVLLLLAAALCLSLLPAAAFARETDYFASLPEAFDFDALQFNAQCIPDLISVCESTKAMLPHLDREEQLCAAFDQIAALRAEVDAQHALITILYYQNPGRYANDYFAMTSGINSAAQAVTSTLQAMLTDPVYSEVLTAHAGSSRILSLLRQNAVTAEQAGIKDEETALVMQYQNAAAADQGVYVDGQYWTLRGALLAYYANKLSYPEYRRIAVAAYAERNAALGSIYLKLISLRNRLAATVDSPDYASYAYAWVYGRDYTRADAAVFRSAVKTHLVPLLESLQTAAIHGCFSDGTTYDGVSEAVLLDTIEPYLDDISSEYGEAFAYMRQCNLIDAAYSSTKLPASFTSMLPVYDAPYILCSRSGGNQDLTTVIHEFGHFSALCYGAESACYDVLEVHSQGLVALMLCFADALYGEEAGAQVGHELFELLRVICLGCMYDELQEYAYTTPALTLEMLNRKSAQLAVEYGQTPFGPEGIDYTWVEVTHTFEAPMYYISYATSAIIALEFYLDARLNGLEHAADSYLSFVANSVCSSGFRTVVADSGLADPFTSGTVENLVQKLEGRLYSDIYGMPYQDVDSCWAKDDIALLYLMGIMLGTSDTEFSPDSTLTRGMAVTVLHRALGKPKSSVAAPAVFEDVAADSWYASAVGWAIESGVTKGASETSFLPDAMVTCQEFATMIFRACFGADAEYTDAPAQDGEADWAADALAWCRDCAIFESDGDAIAPTQQLNRAELAAALVNMLAA